MSDHIHIAASGERDNLLAFFRLFRRRLARYSSNRSTPLPDSFQPTLKEIADLRSLRNTIVYINRNGYVVDPSFTPFSYPWGTGRYYYNDIPCVDAVSNYSTRELRTLLKCDTPGVPPDFKIINGHISPTSFCAIKFGMAMFRDAHHYFALLTKNVEAYSELAAELDDGEFLTDAELFTQVWNITTGALPTARSAASSASANTRSIPSSRLARSDAQLVSKSSQKGCFFRKYGVSTDGVLRKPS